MCQLPLSNPVQGLPWHTTNILHALFPMTKILPLLHRPNHYNTRYLDVEVRIVSRYLSWLYSGRWSSDAILLWVDVIIKVPYNLHHMTTRAVTFLIHNNQGRWFNLAKTMLAKTLVKVVITSNLLGLRVH